MRVRKLSELSGIIFPRWFGFPFMFRPTFNSATQPSTPWTSAACFHTHPSPRVHFMSAVWGNITEQYSQRCFQPTENKHKQMFPCLLLRFSTSFVRLRGLWSCHLHQSQGSLWNYAPASAARQLLLSSLQSVCKSPCEFNLPPDFTPLPISWRFPGLQMTDAKAQSASSNTTALVCGLKLQFKFGNKSKSNCQGILFPAKWFSEEEEFL